MADDSLYCRSGDEQHQRCPPSKCERTVCRSCEMNFAVQVQIMLHGRPLLCFEKMKCNFNEQLLVFSFTPLLRSRLALKMKFVSQLICYIEYCV